MNTTENFPDALITGNYVVKRGTELLERYRFFDWTIEIDRRARHRRLGSCWPYQKTITVSQFYIDNLNDRSNPETIRPDLDSLLLHEIAHAFKPEDHHWLPWKRMFVRLLWDHFRENPELVEDALIEDDFCISRYKELLEYAKRQEEEPFQVSPKRVENQ